MSCAGELGWSGVVVRGRGGTVFGDTYRSTFGGSAGDDVDVTAAEINLIVLRSDQLQLTRGFYESLGLSFAEEKHGQGPAHLSATTPSGTVLELYPLSGDERPETGTRGVRLGFVVPDVMAVIEAVVVAGGTVMSSDQKAAVLKDPDGRKVELTAREG